MYTHWTQRNICLENALGGQKYYRAKLSQSYTSVPLNQMYWEVYCHSCITYIIWPSSVRCVVCISTICLILGGDYRGCIYGGIRSAWTQGAYTCGGHCHHGPTPAGCSQWLQNKTQAWHSATT